MNPDKVIAVHSFPHWLPQTQTWLYQQVKHLPGETEVHVVCDRTINIDQFRVENLHCLYNDSLLQFGLEKGIRRLFYPQYRKYLATIAMMIGAQIIHSHFGPIGWIDVRAAKQADCRHVVTFYGYDVGMLPAVDRRWLGRYGELFSQADLFLCEGPHMAESLIALGCPRGKIRVHHLGVDVRNISFEPRSWREGEPLRVLIAASFREKKGIPYALEALAQLRSEMPLEITLIGDADIESRSQQEKARILEVIEKGGLATRIRFLGYQPHAKVFEEVYRHHIFISPSVTASNGDTEGGAPVTLIEMMATGIPVISTMHCDIPEVVQYGIDNWLVEERDVAGLVDRVRWLLGHHDGWETMLRAGREHIEREYDAIVQGRRLLNIYRDRLRGISA